MLILNAVLSALFPKPALFPGLYIALAISTVSFISGCNNLDDNQSTNANRKVPQSLIASSGARTVVLEWAGVPDASAYTVYWSNNPGVKRDNSKAIQTTIPHYEHLGLNNGTDYYYVVSSHTGAGESSLSNEVRGQPQLAAPVKPADLRLKAEDQRITIDFDIDPSVADYQLLWSTNADRLSLTGDNAERIYNIGAPFVHTNLDNGQNYFYRLRASSADGKSTDSEIFQASPQLALPLTPLITDAIASSGQVVIHWANASNAESFDLYWSTSPDVTTDNAYVQRINSPYTHAPLNQVAGQHYYYRIQALNRAGESPLSNEVHVTTPDGASITAAGEPPAPPTEVKFRVADSQLTLDWQAAAGPQSLGYNLYWQIGNNVYDPNTVVDKNNYSGIIRNVKPPYTHIGLQNNLYYYYRISAINHAGESTLTAPTPVISTKPEAIVAGVPSGVAVIAGDQSLTVRWNPVDRADSYNLTIEGLSSGTTVVPNVTSPHSLDNLNLVNGTSYSIFLQSVSAAKHSGPSAIVQATPNVALPNPPTGLVAIPSDSSVLLQWRSAITQTSIDPAQGQVSEYNVYWANHSGVTADNGALYDTSNPVEVSPGNWQLNVQGLNNGRRHYFVVTASNYAGEGPASLVAWALPQVPAPSAPTEVYAEPGNNIVFIHFQPATDVTGTPSYNLYWSKDIDNQRSATQIITNIPQTPTYAFTDGNSNGTTYYFQVSATNAGGESVYSTEVSATPQVPAPALAPANVAVINASGQVDLSWESVAGASDYAVYWSTGTNIDSDTSAVLYSANDLTLNHPDLVNGQSYFYRVAALNAGGRGPVSALIAGNPQVDPPATPSTFAALAGNAQVTLNWAADISTTNPASSYELRWRYLNETTWSYLPGVASGYVHSNLSNVKSYQYQLVAQNAGGNSLPTAIQTAAPQQPPTAIPTGLSVAAGDKQNSISWFTQPDIAYKLYWSTGTTEPIAGGQFFDMVSPTFVHGSVTPLTNGEIYHYKIVATFVDVNNNSFISDPSIQVSATPAAILPGAPTGLSAQAGDQQVTLNWFAPSDAQASTTYTLYWGNQSGVAPNTPINNVQLPYVHTGRTNAQEYYYRLTATTGGVESNDSNLASAKPMPALPAMPLGVSVTAGNGSNTVNWLTVTAASSYSVESSVSGAFDDTQSNPVMAPGTQFIHSGLSNGQTVFYRVVAINSNSDRSGYSSIVSGTPQAEVIPSNSRPSASNVSISDNNNGNLTTGTILTGQYTYNDIDGDLEGATSFQWYRANTAIAGETNTSYVVTTLDAGLTLSFAVTPIALTGTNPGLAQRANVNINAINSAPVASNVIITDSNGNAIVVGDSLTGSYSYNDIDEDLEGISTYQWYRNGSAISNATDIDYTLLAADADQNISFEVIPVAASGTSPGLAASSSVTVINSRPVASNVSISDNNSGVIVVDVVLTGNYTYSDVDNDAEGNTSFQWFRNGIAITNATAASYTVTTADSGQPIRFEVTPMALTGANPGATAFAVLSVGNSAPLASNVSIGGGTAGTIVVNDTLTVDYFYSDVDGDTEGATTFQWYRNGSSLGTSAINQTYTVVAADSGQLLSAHVIPIATAGTNPGLKVTAAEVSITNSAPTLSSVSIIDSNGGNILVDDNLSSSYVYNDVDGDARGAPLYQWFADNNPITDAIGQTFVVTAAESGAVLRVEITPVALTGVLTGAADTSPGALVVNTAPTALGVSISDDNLGSLIVGDAVSSTYTYADADLDAEGITTYQWFSNNSPISGANNPSYIVTAAESGFQLRLEITPVAQTGILSGAAHSSQILNVANSVPEASNVLITDLNGASAEVNDTLEASYDYFDLDNDAPGSSIYVWKRDGTPIGGANALTYIVQAIDAGRSLTFEVTPVATAGANPGITQTSLPIDVSQPVADISKTIVTITYPNSGTLTEATAGDLVDIDVQVRDINDNPVAATVAMKITGANIQPLGVNNPGLGNYASSYNANKMGADTFIIEINTVTVLPAPFLIVNAASASIANSSVTVTPPGTALVGDTIVIELTLRDVFDNFTTGNVVMSVTAGSANPQPLVPGNPGAGIYLDSYVATVAGVDNYSITVDGLPIAVPSTTISIGAAPITSLTYPRGINTLVGTQNITWNTTDNNPATVEIRLSTNSGTSYDTVIDAAAPDTGTYGWDTTTLPDGDAYRIQLIATDGDGQTSTASRSFANVIIDNVSTPVTILSPADQSYNVSTAALISGECDAGFTINVSYDANTSGPATLRCDGGTFTNLYVLLNGNDLVPLSTITLSQTNSTTTTNTTLTLKTQGVGNWTNIPSTLLHGHSAVWAQDALLVWGGSDGYAQAVLAGELIDPAIGGTGTRLSSTGAPGNFGARFCYWAEATVTAGPRYVLICRYDAAESRIYDKLNDSWSPVNTVGHPTSISKVLGVGQFVAVWDNNQVGSLYDVVNDTWEPFPTVGAPNEANCCGAISANDTQLFMFGSFTDTPPAPYNYTQNGYILDVYTKTWTTLPITVNTPAVRTAAQSVWDGTSFIVWGGYTAFVNYDLANGARYNPSSNSWTPLATAGGPSDSRGTLGIVGTEMIVIQDQTTFIYNTLNNTWSNGGTTDPIIADRSSYSISFAANDVYVLGGVPNDAGSSSMMLGRLATYNLGSKSWSNDGLVESPVITSNISKEASLVWDTVNSQAILWNVGGGDIQGGRFNPTTLTWTPVSMVGIVANTFTHYTRSVWSGTTMLTWSSDSSTGFGRTYNPQFNSWSAWSDINKHDFPAPVLAWLGSEVFSWSNSSAYKFVTATTPGRLYNPVTNTWRAISDINAPLPKESTRTPAVTIGNNRVLIWSGILQGVNPIVVSSTGHIFDSSTNTWTPISTVNAPTPRSGFAAVWTGSDYIVYGGKPESNTYLNDGGRYNLATDTWSTMSTDGAPVTRDFPIGVWTGTHALFWGNGSGGLYDPVTDSWTPLRLTGNPGGGAYPLAVWMGDGLLLLNGNSSDTNTGAIWRP